MPSPRHTRLVLVLAGVWCSGARSDLAARDDGAPDYYARTWTTDEGLPHSMVEHIIQDQAGYIWLATLGGLARFDGREFKTFDLPPEMQQRGYNIRGLAEETDSSLLLVLPTGNVVRLHRGAFSLHPITNSLNGDSPDEIFAEPGGAVWVGTGDDTLFRWQNGRTTKFGKDDGIDRRAPMFSFAIDRQGRTWIGTGSFLGYYSGGSLVRFGQPLGQMILIAPAHSGGIWILADSRLLRLEEGRLTVVLSAPTQLPAAAIPRQIFEDHHHAVWIATRRQGLYRYAQGKLEHIAGIDDFTNTVAEDREGDIWVGTGGSGVSMLRQKSFSLFATEVGLAEKISGSVCVDRAGDVWFANRQGGAVRYQDGHFSVVRGTDKLVVNSVCPDSKGGLWLGVAQGLYHLSPDSSLPVREFPLPPMDIRTLFCARNGDLWFANSKGVVGYIHGDSHRLFTSEDGYAAAGGTAIAEDRTGAIWIGGESGSLWQFAGGRLARVSLPTEMPVSPIHALYVDASGLLWMGTANGLILRQGGEFKRFTEAQGLSDGMIFQIQEDNLGYLWLGSRHGLYRVQLKSLLGLAAGSTGQISSVTLGKEDGLPPISLLVNGQPLSWKDPAGTLWFTTLQGVLAVDPTKISSPAAHPPVLVQQTLIDGRAQDPASPLRVPPGRHRLEFQFGVLSYAAAGKIHLRHQLEGIDPAWVETDGTRWVSYSSLPPGKYRLRATAEGGGTALDFSVSPAWWQTLWARAGALVVLVGVLGWGFSRYAYWRLQRELQLLKQEHAVEEERTRIARDLHDELGSSLTRITFGVEQLKRRLAGSQYHPLMEQLSQRVRRHANDLDRVVWVESSKNDSLDRVASFIGRFAQEYFRDSSLNCLVRIADRIPSERIKPEVQHNLIAFAKEALNNVLKHARATEVVITADFNQSSFALTIQDNGTGFTPTSAEDYDHNGMNNMRARVAEIGGKLEIFSQPGAGAKVSVLWELDSRLRATPASEILKVGADPA